MCVQPYGDVSPENILPLSFMLSILSHEFPCVAWLQMVLMAESHETTQNIFPDTKIPFNLWH